jgi:chromosome partitioning protein
MARTIAVANQKGGCGKTTIAINLAASLSLRDENVLLIDLDPQGHTSLGLGVDIENLEAGMYDVMAAKDNGSSSIENTICHLNSKLDLAPTNVSLCAIEQMLAGKEGREFRLKKQLKHISELYNYIIIDCPPSLGLLTFNALLAADELIIPVESSLYSFQGVGKLLETVALLKEELGHTLDYYILFSMFEGRTKFSRELLDKTIDTYGDHVLNTKINYTIKLKEAANKGKPITRYRSKRSRAFKDFFNLACEIENLKILNKISNIKLDVADFQLPLKMTNGIYFAIQNKNASNVHVVGNFNNWKANEESRLRSDGFGGWRKFIGLQPGSRYHYKYLVDGEWVEDHNNPRREPSPYGGFNSIIEI